MVPVPTIEPLTAENVLWANTVLAAGSAVGFVIYTGPETRAVMNTSHPETKVGLLDIEINRLAKVSHYAVSCSTGRLIKTIDSLRSDIRIVLCSRCAERLSWSLVHLHFPILNPVLVYYTHQVRYLCLTIFVLMNKRSLRVNLDMGKTVYAQQIMTDSEIPGTIVRTSTLPEELGRIEYLLSDKTGTLTQNGTYPKGFVTYRQLIFE
jgi:phospholipid-translocating ATPase